MIRTGARQDRAERISGLGWARKTRSGTVAGVTVTGIVVGCIWPALEPGLLPEKQTICHSSSAVSNPYQQISVSVLSIVKDNGHGAETGPVYPTPGWGDIIPPFDYTDADGKEAHYPRLKLDRGRNRFCKTSSSSSSNHPSTRAHRPPHRDAVPNPDVLPHRLGIRD